MAFAYRNRPIGTTWPGPRTARHQRSPFGANWGDTMALLEREIRQLGGRDVVLAVEVGARDIRNDGGIRADARIKVPAVCVEFRVGPDLLQFPCDTFDYWQDNVRAIALALEALRKVDRYGVRKGSQYEGFKALPGAGGTTQTMTITAAADLLAFHDGLRDAASILSDPQVALVAIRRATGRTHPDAGGRAEVFVAVQSAAALVKAHHAPMTVPSG